jgi:hypothetical protein
MIRSDGIAAPFWLWRAPCSLKNREGLELLWQRVRSPRHSVAVSDRRPLEERRLCHRGKVYR